MPALGIERSLDRREDASEVFVDLVIPESDNPIPVFRQNTITLAVICGLPGMLAAVEFDDESACRAGEIDYVRPDRHLTPELRTVELSAAELTPQLALYLRLVAA